jgi:hypothetical protein
MSRRGKSLAVDTIFHSRGAEMGHYGNPLTRVGTVYAAFTFAHLVRLGP